MMRASVGDRIVIVRAGITEPVRDGEIVELGHEDGSPPYVVCWSDTDRTSLVFPGPDARIIHYDHAKRN